MDFEDLRGFIKKAEAMGELRRIDGADWNLEIGAINQVMATRRGPALLFDQVKDYPKGFRTFSNGFTSFNRTGLILRIPSENGGIQMLQEWRRKRKTFKPVGVKVVKNGPIFENRLEDGAVDIYKFPTPKWNEHDGGRYIGTGCVVITRDPETGWVNLGTYRVMIHDKNRVGIMMNRGKHGAIMMDKYHAKGESCPVAISFGHDPTIFFASTYDIPSGTSEYEFAGWLRGAPVEVVEGPLTGLPIPANSEIVVEGEIPPLEETEKWNLKEGPFGEWPGYYTPATTGEMPVVIVKSVHFRNNPIILGAPHVKPPAPTIFALPLSAVSVWEELDSAGIPDVKGVWRLGSWGGGHGGSFLVIAIKQRYAGHAKQAALSAVSCRSGAYGGKVIIVVDDDIDITDPGEVLWAVGTRFDVDHLDTVKDVWTSPVDPALSPELRATRCYTSSRMIIDACKPYRWMKDFPIVNAANPELRRNVIRKWRLDEPGGEESVRRKKAG